MGLSEVLEAQRNEITEHYIYRMLASIEKGKNREVLERISRDELNHYKMFRKISCKDVGPDWIKVYFHYYLARIFGLNFSLRLMERGEKKAQDNYFEVGKRYAHFLRARKDEERHESKILEMIDEERLRYTGSFILGLSDALVELTGALAGFTLALGNTRLIATVGLITGIAATLSMAGSEYLSSSEEGKEPLKSMTYTATAYLFTVFLLISPFFLFDDAILSLIFTLAIAFLIILTFTFYISVAKGIPFKKRFFEMAMICFGVAVINFAIGLIAKEIFGIKID
ncbi:MAG: VIT1/CCC1 transporter family protein [Candidatus Micrarchaeota archaeon]|nr:VIT1/CCC1 transporter family protein [Candidatus Micrarchaeota archaeon]